MKLIQKSNAVIEGNTDPAAQFEKARESIEKLHSSLVSRVERVNKNRGLRQDDGIADAYRELLESVAILHSQFDTISEMLGEHGADVGKPKNLH